MCADKQVILMEQRLVEYSQSLSQAANMGLGEINPQIRYTHTIRPHTCAQSPVPSSGLRCDGEDMVMTCCGVVVLQAEDAV